MIVEFCGSYLFYKRIFILKLVLRCDCKSSVRHIQTGNMDWHPPQACGWSFWGWRFLLLHLSPSINWFSSRQLLNFFNIAVVYVSIGPRGTKDHWVNSFQSFVLHHKVVCYIFLFVILFFMLLSKGALRPIE